MKNKENILLLIFINDIFNLLYLIFIYKSIKLFKFTLIFNYVYFNL